jgi:hypothetical protein
MIVLISKHLLLEKMQIQTSECRVVEEMNEG